MHIEHPDTHTHGLHDGCLRCAEHAERPTGLDGENLRRIWSGDIKTRMDMDAYNLLYRSVVLTQRLTEAFQYAEFDEHCRDQPGFGAALASFTPTPAHEIDLFTVGGRR